MSNEVSTQEMLILLDRMFAAHLEKRRKKLDSKSMDEFERSICQAIRALITQAESGEGECEHRVWLEYTYDTWQIECGKCGLKMFKPHRQPRPDTAKGAEKAKNSTTEKAKKVTREDVLVLWRIANAYNEEDGVYRLSIWLKERGVEVEDE